MDTAITDELKSIIDEHTIMFQALYEISILKECSVSKAERASAVLIEIKESRKK